jgi:hypothetical protein
MRVMRVNCDTSTCTATCNSDEVLVTAYCGPGRAAPVVVNEKSASCPSRRAAASPFVAMCVKAP